MKFRKELQNVKRIVVKVGSVVITKKNGNLNTVKLRAIVEDISQLTSNNVEVVLVSSGAVSIGKNFLDNSMKNSGSINSHHCASAIGQPKLIYKYSQLFESKDIVCSQILLTQDDLRDRKRFLFAKNNIETLLSNKIVPILNENDSITYSENTVEDNDHLAAAVAQMINADLLLVITGTDGLYDRDPSIVGAKKIKHVNFTHGIQGVDFKGVSKLGRGGMESKVQALEKVSKVGINSIISSKNRERLILEPLLDQVGTYFFESEEFTPEQRGAWLMSLLKAKCSISVDEGAYKALMSGKSLLAAGVIDVIGQFFRGDGVKLVFKDSIFAFGVTEYCWKDVLSIKGRHSNEIETVLGFKSSNSIIHTNNLILNKGI